MPKTDHHSNAKASGVLCRVSGCTEWPGERHRSLFSWRRWMSAGCRVSRRNHSSTTFLGTFVPLYIFSCCFLFFLRKLLLLLIGPAPTWKWMVEVGAPCPRAFFSPCSQASVALFLFCYESPFQCRVTVILWGFSIRLHQVCVLAHTVWLDGPGKVPCLNFSTYIMGSHLHPAHGVEHDSTCKGISIVPGIEDVLNEW